MENIDATYRFIEFVSHPSVPRVWVCRNRKSKDVLGGVEYYAPWRQYVFSAVETAVFSHDCLGNIQDFLKIQAPKLGRKYIEAK